MARHTKSKKQLIKVITQYGIHIWAILIIANAVMVYTYHFASNAAGKNPTPKFLNASRIPTPSNEVSPPENSPSQAQPTPNGDPMIDLSFTVPGIGSGGGVMKPIHLRRNVTVFLYATDVNSLNPTVKPLYTIQGYAIFDSNPESGTYTSFINPTFDLGSAVLEGNYQISFRTDQSLRTIIKQNPTDIGGQVFGLSKNSDPVILPPQTVLMGDIVPDQGDNVINISDYNAFINCYGSKNTSSFCQGKNYGDFNDDGVVDGIDYNILLRSLNTLVQEGISTPIITPTPATPKRISRLISHVTPTKTQKEVKPTPTPKTVQTQKNGNSPIGAIFFIIIFALLGTGAFIFYRRNPEMLDTLLALIRRSPTGIPDSLETPTEGKTTDNSAKSADEIPTKKLVIEKPTQDKEPVNSAKPHPAGGEIEKDYYIKVKGPDEAGVGTWLQLTDDNGPVRAHYAKKDAKDGFAKVKGMMKTENGKTFLEISEIAAEE
jgi:hypothetical protein